MKKRMLEHINTRNKEENARAYEHKKITIMLKRTIESSIRHNVRIF